MPVDRQSRGGPVGGMLRGGELLIGDAVLVLADGVGPDRGAVRLLDVVQRACSLSGLSLSSCFFSLTCVFIHSSFSNFVQSNMYIHSAVRLADVVQPKESDPMEAPSRLFYVVQRACSCNLHSDCIYISA